MDITVDYTDRFAKNKFTNLLREYGFCVLKNHPIPWEDITTEHSEWTNFFLSETKHKKEYKFNPLTQDGFIPRDHPHQAANSKLKIADIKEIYQLYFPWGRYPDEVSGVSKKLFYKKLTLASELLAWIEESLPEKIKNKLKKPLSELPCVERTLYRCIHYPKLNYTEPVGAVRCAEHQDIDLLTILPAATQPGLQLMNTSNEWVDVDFGPKTLAINIGGILEEITDSFYKATPHRVVNPENETKNSARLSCPLFLHPRETDFISERFPTAKSYKDYQHKLLGLNVAG